MDHFNSESALPGTLASDDSLTAAEIMTAMLPALIGMRCRRPHRRADAPVTTAGVCPVVGGSALFAVPWRGSTRRTYVDRERAYAILGRMADDPQWPRRRSPATGRQPSHGMLDTPGQRGASRPIAASVRTWRGEGPGWSCARPLRLQRHRSCHAARMLMRPPPPERLPRQPPRWWRDEDGLSSVVAVVMSAVALRAGAAVVVCMRRWCR